MVNHLIKLFGYSVTIFFGDPAVFDRWRWLRKHLRSGPLRTLDAGCGSGALTFYAAKRGNEAVGVSFQDRNNEVAKERARILGLANAIFVEGDLRVLDTLKTKLGIFDQIICFETIEHILGDDKLIRDFASILKPGGQILLTAPYKHYNRIMGASISEVENGSHVRWGYTHEEITTLFAKHSLVVTGRAYLTGLISQRLIRSYRLLSMYIPYRLVWALLFPLRICVALDQLVTKIFHYPYLSIAVVAEKRALQ